MTIGWFVDGQYMFETWGNLKVQDKLSYIKLRNYIEQNLCDSIDEAYYLNADSDPPTAKSNKFHNALAYPPPTGPGLRVKLYWLQKKALYWLTSMGGGPVIHPVSGEQYILTQQKAVDVGLAHHLTRSHANRRWNKLALCAGDGDFHEVVQYLVESKNVDVYLIGELGSISEELRPYARKVFEVSKIIDEIKGM